LFFAAMCAAYLLVAGLFAVVTPPWQAPDEPAHYNYIAQVANNRCCPVIEVGDWNQAYLSQLTSQRFAPHLLTDLDRLQYEDHQPPLYYLLASLVFKLTDGSLLGLRLFSALMGLAVVWSTYAIGRALYPERPWIGLGAAALVAFLPQHVATLASVNNDGLAEGVIGVTMLATVLYLKRDDEASDRTRRAMSLQRMPFILGVLVGIGFLTKASTLLLAAIVPLAIVLKWWDERAHVGDVGTQHAVSLQTLITRLALFAIPALLLGAIWWARNVGVYGWPDFLGLRQHDLVVADQLRTVDFIAENGWQAYLSRAFGETFNSFWGQFGWMALPMPAWTYGVIQVLLLLVASGWVIEVAVLRRRREFPTPSGSNRSAWIILNMTALLSLLAYVYYNTEFVQHQGRYLFPGLIPFALWMALGVDAWRRLIFENGRKAMWPYPQWLAPVAFLPLALLDVYLALRVIAPGLSP
jgi:4-amino-4-deoxy-L-arabinose transferase-like glycosyltransferase